MIKGEGNGVVDWIWMQCNMALESGVVPENRRAVVPLYKGKGEKTECSNYRGVILLSVIGKIYVGILVDRVRKVTEGFIDDEQERFKAGKGYVDQIFTLKKICEKTQEKNIKCMWVLWTWRRQMIGVRVKDMRRSILGSIVV